MKADIIGFRQWHLCCGLSAMTFSYQWTAGENRARCAKLGDAWDYSCDEFREDGDHAPGRGCSCGFYGYHHVDGLSTVCPRYIGSYVPGAIRVWGRMQVHQRGFRVEYAEPIMLAYSRKHYPDEIDEIQAVGSEFGLDVVPLSQLEERAAVYGKSLPEVCLPRSRDEHLRRAAWLVAGTAGALSVGAYCRRKTCSP